jgi:nicotinamidase-related amidase
VPIDITPYLDPATSAVVNMECQENLIGPNSRRVGTRVYYCTDDRRPDGFGRATNTLVHLRMPGGQEPTGGQGPIVEPLTPHDEDIVFPREQGLTGFFGTGLDAYLRNTGVKTVIVTGVSLNIAVLGTTIEAMNLGYQVIVPSDCVASDPPEYAESALRYTIRNIALECPSAAIVEHWQGIPIRP